MINYATVNLGFYVHHLTHLAIQAPVTHTVKYNNIPYFSIDNARVIYKKRSKFVKNEHARYTLGTKKGKNLERLITAASQARF